MATESVGTPQVTCWDALATPPRSVRILMTDGTKPLDSVVFEPLAREVGAAGALTADYQIRVKGV